MQTLHHVSESGSEHNISSRYPKIFGCTPHAQWRFEERFGGKLTPELVVQWRKLILQGACSKRPGNVYNRDICFCHWTAKNVEVPVIYDYDTDVIVTVLPRASVQVVA